MMSNVEMLLRLVTAAALGSLIGFERERLLWAAGIRTHMLVCVGIWTVAAVGLAVAGPLSGRQHLDGHHSDHPGPKDQPTKSI
jgi:putative Mg2+ transporter-C (MgtC) family protein